MANRSRTPTPVGDATGRGLIPDRPELNETRKEGRHEGRMAGGHAVGSQVVGPPKETKQKENIDMYKKRIH